MLVTLSAEPQKVSRAVVVQRTRLVFHRRRVSSVSISTETNLRKTQRAPLAQSQTHTTATRKGAQAKFSKDSLTSVCRFTDGRLLALRTTKFRDLREVVRPQKSVNDSQDENYSARKRKKRFRATPQSLNIRTSSPQSRCEGRSWRVTLRVAVYRQRQRLSSGGS